MGQQVVKVTLSEVVRVALPALLWAPVIRRREMRALGAQPTPDADGRDPLLVSSRWLHTYLGRSREQFHTGLYESVTALTFVASLAGRHQVDDVRTSTLRPRYDVVDSAGCWNIRPCTFDNCVDTAVATMAVVTLMHGHLDGKRCTRASPHRLGVCSAEHVHHDSGVEPLVLGGPLRLPWPNEAPGWRMRAVRMPTVPGTVDAMRPDDAAGVVGLHEGSGQLINGREGRGIFACNFSHVATLLQPRSVCQVCG